MIKAILFIGFVATVVVANWAVSEFGAVRVGLGLRAPAGVYVVGLAFTLRDLLQDAAGKRAVVAAIVLGAVVSYRLESTDIPTSLDVLRTIAGASAAAFAVSETVDFVIYTASRRWSWLGAVALSNGVSLVIDSAVFLWLAFGSLEFISGQIFAKAYMTAAAIVVLGVYRAFLSRDTQTALAEAG